MDFSEFGISSIVKLKRKFIGVETLRLIALNKLRVIIMHNKFAIDLQNLLPSMVRELYESFFFFKKGTFVGFATDLLSLSPRKQFEVWLKFIDKNETRKMDLPEISRDFSLEVVTFLEKNTTHLESIQMYYNWILNKVYINAFMNLPQLKNLTIRGYLDDEFLKLISQHSKLESLNICGGVRPEEYEEVRYGMTSGGISRFLSSQKDSLRKIDLLQMYYSRFFIGAGSSSLVSCFKSNLPDFLNLKLLQSLTISSDMFMLINKSIQSMEEIVLSFKQATKISYERNIFGSILELCPNLKKVSLLDLKLNSSIAIMNNNESDIMLKETSFIQALKDKLGELVIELSAFLYGSLDWNSILNHTPNVEKASFVMECEIIGANDLSMSSKPRIWNNLKTLSITGSLSECDFHAHLQPVLLNSPKLTECTLIFYGFTPNFNEDSFLKKIQSSSLRSLETLRIHLYDKSHVMSGLTIIELLSRCSKLRYLDNIKASFNMSLNEFLVIKRMVHQRGLELIVS